MFSKQCEKDTVRFTLTKTGNVITIYETDMDQGINQR